MAAAGDGVRITNREIFDQLVAVEKVVGRLSDAVDDLSDHENRIRVLEVNQADLHQLRKEVDGIRGTVTKVVVGVSIAFCGAFFGAVFTVLLKK